MLTRRSLMAAAGAGAALGGSALGLPKLFEAQAEGAPITPGVPAGVTSSAALEALPGKKPLIRLSYRPPNYESPLDYFRTPITPNDQFFIRYHLSNIPETIDPKTYRIEVGGDGANGQTEISLDDLKKMTAYEVVAVNQCSGNRRGLSNPHVAGVEWGYGAMGCARWKGARLKDILGIVGLKPEAIEIAFNGADGPAFEKVPDFIKSVPVWKAMDDSTIVAYEMNGTPLPHYNGFPARLIVPGWTGTYWMKHLISITALTKPQGGFWMAPAYRVPLGLFPVVQRFTSQETPGGTNTPITEMVINSLITSHTDGAKSESRQDHRERARLGCRLRHLQCHGFDRWRQNLVDGDARRGFRPFRIPAVELHARRQEGKEHGDGQCQQQDRPDPDAGAVVQSGGLQQQRDAEH